MKDIGLLESILDDIVFRKDIAESFTKKTINDGSDRFVISTKKLDDTLHLHTAVRFGIVFYFYIY